MSEQKTFAFIYNNPFPGFAVLWPNWYENDKEYLDATYKVITEYDIKNLGWSAWLVNSQQPFIVLDLKEPEVWNTEVDQVEPSTTKPKKKK